MWREKHTAPEDLSDVHDAPKARAPFGPSVWYALPGGRDAGAEPRRLLPMICKMGNLDRDDIGAIRVQDDQSFIEVRESAVATLVEALRCRYDFGKRCSADPSGKCAHARAPRPPFQWAANRAAKTPRWRQTKRQAASPW